MNTFSFFEKKSTKFIDNTVFWKVVWVLFSIKNEEIKWFIVKKSFITYDYFLIEDIKEVNENEIIINKNEKSEIEFTYEIIWKIVKNEEKRSLWIVQDLEFDNFYKLKSIIIDEWYFLSWIEIVDKKQLTIKKSLRKVSKKHIISYEKDCIIIKDKLLIDNNKKNLENFYKIFITMWNPSYNLKK